MARFSYGGQALIEGVLMRGRDVIAVALRHPDGRIVWADEKLAVGFRATRWARLPFVRGLVVLYETLVVGTRWLVRSAGVAAVEELGPAARPAPLPPVTAEPGAAPTAVEGVTQVTIFLGYLTLIGRTSDVRRTFQYHGAEHMSIHALEAGDPLTVEAVRKYPTAHPRCGTEFLVVVILVSIITFSLVGRQDIVIMITMSWRPTRLKVMIETRMTTTRNSVPHRGCAVGYLRTASTVSGSPASRAWIDMCSAPWYWNVRRTSEVRPISVRYPRKIVTWMTPSTARSTYPVWPPAIALASRSGTKKNRPTPNTSVRPSMSATAPFPRSALSATGAGVTSGVAVADETAGATGAAGPGSTDGPASGSAATGASGAGRAAGPSSSTAATPADRTSQRVPTTRVS